MIVENRIERTILCARVERGGVSDIRFVICVSEEGLEVVRKVRWARYQGIECCTVGRSAGLEGDEHLGKVYRVWRYR